MNKYLISKYILIFCYDDKNNIICNSLNKLLLIDLNYNFWNEKIKFYKNNIYCPEIYNINDDADIYKLNYKRINDMSFLEKSAYILNLLFKIYDLKEYVYSSDYENKDNIESIYNELIKYKKIVIFDKEEKNKKISIKYIKQTDDYIDNYQVFPIGSIFRINYKDENIKLKKNIFYNQNKFIENYKYQYDKNFDNSLILDDNRNFILSNKIYEPFGDYIYSIIKKENIKINEDINIDWLIDNYFNIGKDLILKLLNLLLDNFKVIDYVYDEICKIYSIINEEINNLNNHNNYEIKETLLILSTIFNKLKYILNKNI